MASNYQSPTSGALSSSSHRMSLDKETTPSRSNFGGLGESSAATRSTPVLAKAEMDGAPLQSSEYWQRVTQATSCEEVPLRLWSPVEADSEVKPLAQPLQIGTVKAESEASFGTIDLDPTPMRTTELGYDTSQNGQELDNSGVTNRSCASIGTSQIPSNATFLKTTGGAVLQEQVPVALGWSGPVPQVSFARNAIQQNNQNFAIQQRAGPLPTLPDHSFMLPQILQTELLHSPVPLLAAGSNPLVEVASQGPDGARSASFRMSGEEEELPGAKIMAARSGAAAGTAAGESRRQSVVAMPVRSAETDPSKKSIGSEKTETPRYKYNGKRKPKRALTAYNIFFKDERARLLAATAETGEARINQGPKRQRKKIGFDEMGKVIGKNWKQIDPLRRLYYDKQAANDKKRYKTELGIYNKRQCRIIEMEKEKREKAESTEKTLRRKELSDNEDTGNGDDWQGSAEDRKD